jgi:PTS system ascorbate-specific IIA component
MIDGFQLTKDLIRFEEKFDNWEEAIKTSSESLVEGNYIDENYVNEMIQSVKDYGPYIVIAPNIAMPHARPEAGSKKVGFSVMVCQEPVAFSDQPEHEARLFVTLSCVSADTHLKMMQALVEVLGDDKKVQNLLSTTDKEEVLKIFGGK